MKLPTTGAYRLKAILLTHDGGKTWIVARQYYVVDLKADKFIDIQTQGEILVESPTKDEDHVR